MRKTTADSFTRNCSQFSECWVCCLNFCMFGLYISISEKYARRTAQWTDTFIHYWRPMSLTSFDRFPRTHLSLSVLVTQQQVLSVCVFPTSSMMPQIELILNVIISWLPVLHHPVHVPETSVLKGACQSFSLWVAMFLKYFLWLWKSWSERNI